MRKQHEIKGTECLGEGTWKEDVDASVFKTTGEGDWKREHRSVGPEDNDFS